MGCEHLSCKLFCNFILILILLLRGIFGEQISVTLKVYLQQAKDTFLLLELSDLIFKYVIKGDFTCLLLQDYFISFF